MNEDEPKCVDDRWVEDGFREVETSVLAEVSSYKKCVVATGGGIIKRRENWMHLRNGVVLCLSGPASLLAKRVVVGVPAACPRGGGRKRERFDVGMFFW